MELNRIQTVPQQTIKSPLRVVNVKKMEVDVGLWPVLAEVNFLPVVDIFIARSLRGFKRKDNVFL